MTVMTTQAQRHTVLDRLAPLADRDPVVTQGLARGLLRVDGRSLVPSGADRLALAVVRAVVAKPESAAAVALPRGTSPTPVLVGLFAALWRMQPAQGYGRLLGSIAVSTKRAELRGLARRLSFDGSALDETIGIARLVGVPIANEKRVRAAAMPLKSRKRDFLDQQDSWLLFCMPNVAPPVAYQVIGAMVVDTSGSSQGSWEQTWERNRAARRRQFWIGELGSPAFEQFCADHNMPLVRLDWRLLEAACERWGTGSTELATTALAQRALAPVPIAARIVRHEEAEYWLAELQTLLHEMSARARSGETPEVFITARQAAALLARLACPVDDYERVAGRLAFADPVSLLVERVGYATATPFRGRWKPAFNTYWPGIKACLQQLQRLLSDPDQTPKWWALQERLDQAVEAGQRIRVLTQTRAERLAVKGALYGEHGMLDHNDLDRFVEVASFSQRDWHGATGAAVTLLPSPPPERFADIYLAGETGSVEVLCFPFELRRLRRRVELSWRRYTDPEANHVALDRLGLGARPRVQEGIEHETPSELVIEADGFVDRIPFEPPTDDCFIPPRSHEDDFWDAALELRGNELPKEPDEVEEHGEHIGEVTSRAVLVDFADAPSIYFRQDAEVTVIATASDGSPEVGAVEAGELEAGQLIAVLPGAERGSLLDVLMNTWDEHFALPRDRYVPMYEAALDAAEAKHGTQGLADKVGVTAGAVRSWVRRKNRPQQPHHLRSVLEASGHGLAIENGAIIQKLFERTRGAHRLIGRILNDCVQETVLHGATGGESARKLQELVGVDLTDLFDNVFVLLVASVSAPRDNIPTGVCGSFLDATDPYLRAKGVL